MAKRGRKTKYRPELCQKLIDHFSIEPFKDVQLAHYDKSNKKDENGNRLVVWYDIKRMANKLPSLVNFAQTFHIGVSTVYDWVNKEHNSYKEAFSEVYRRVCKPLQKEFMIQNGLQGLYNPISFKFIAVNVSDMRDSKELTINKDQEQRELTEKERKEAQRLAKVLTLNKKTIDKLAS